MMSTFGSADERAAAIAELAYRLWEERGCPEGSPDEDWYEAEFIIDQQLDGEGAQENFPDTAPKQVRKKGR